MTTSIPGMLEIQDDTGSVTRITLDGNTATITAGGANQRAEIVLNTGEGKPRVRIGKILWGKKPSQKWVYGISILDDSGYTIAYLGPYANLGLGGHGTGGAIELREETGPVRIRADAEEGIWAHSTGQGPAGDFIVDGWGVGVIGTATSKGGMGVGGKHTENACVGALAVGGIGSIGAAPGTRTTGGGAAAVYGLAGTLVGGGGYGWAGYFDGDVMVGGDLYGGGKHCRIDHPLDPENKYLIHACVESSERLNVYRGSANLNRRGHATIRVPNWLQAFNAEVEYQLTPIGAPAPDLHVAEEIRNGRFKIAGGPPGIRVSWQITGVRADAYATRHPMSVEVPKRGAERGTYLHPVEHGARPIVTRDPIESGRRSR